MWTFYVLHHKESDESRLCFRSKQSAEAYLKKAQNILGDPLNITIQIQENAGRVDLVFPNSTLNILRKKEKEFAQPYNNSGFYIKNVRGDKESYMHSFLESITLGPKGFRKQLRRVPKKQFTVKGTGVEDRKNRTPQYTTQQKEGFSKPQSLSYVNPSQGITPRLYSAGDDLDASVAFMFNKDSVLVNRALIYTDATCDRFYDYMTEIDAKAFFSRESGSTMFPSVEDLEKALVQTHQEQVLTEILGRARCDAHKDAIGISTDSIRSRWLAQAYAHHIERNILPNRDLAYGLAPETNYHIHIYYYLPTSPEHLKPYSELDAALDAEYANALYQDEIERSKMLSNKQFEFLLAADNVDLFLKHDGSKTIFESVMDAGYMHIVELLYHQATLEIKIKISQTLAQNSDYLKQLTEKDHANFLIDCFKKNPSEALYRAIISTKYPQSFLDILLKTDNINQFISVKNNVGLTLLELAMHAKSWEHVIKAIQLGSIPKDKETCFDLIKAAITDKKYQLIPCLALFNEESFLYINSAGNSVFSLALQEKDPRWIEAISTKMSKSVTGKCIMVEAKKDGSIDPEAVLIYEDDLKCEELLKQRKYEFLLGCKPDLLKKYDDMTIFEYVLQSYRPEIAKKLFCNASSESQLKLLEQLEGSKVFLSMLSQDKQLLLDCFKMRPSAHLYKAILETNYVSDILDTLLSSPNIKDLVHIKNSSGRRLINLVCENFDKYIQISQICPIRTEDLIIHLSTISRLIQSRDEMRFKDQLEKIMGLGLDAAVAQSEYATNLIYNPIHFAVTDDRPLLLKILLEQPCSFFLTVKNDKGLTPILSAAAYDDWSMVNTFLDSTANPTSLEDLKALLKIAQDKRLQPIVEKIQSHEIYKNELIREKCLNAKEIIKAQQDLPGDQTDSWYIPK